jgi:hypothetical protein
MDRCYIAREVKLRDALTHETVYVAVEVDFERLAILAASAAKKNKNGKTTRLNRAIRVTYGVKKT